MYIVKDCSDQRYVKEMFAMKATPYELRNKDIIIPKFCTLKDGKNSIRYFGPYLWSKLERTIKELPMLNQFRNTLRRIEMKTLMGYRL